MAGKSMSMAEKLASKVKPLQEDQAAPVQLAVVGEPAAPEVAPSDAAPAESVQAESPSPSKATPKPRVKRSPSPRPSRQSAPVVDDDTEGSPTDTVSAVVTIRKDIDDRLMAYRKTTRKSHPVILFDAIEGTYEQLPELVRIALGKEADSKPRPSLFDRSPRTETPITTGESVVRVDHTIRITRANRRKLTEIAEEVGAPSRNFMMEIAYDAFLPKI